MVLPSLSQSAALQVDAQVEALFCGGKVARKWRRQVQPMEHAYGRPIESRPLAVHERLFVLLLVSGAHLQPG